MHLFQRFTEMAVTKKLRMMLGSVIEVQTSGSAVATISCSELAVLDGILATAAEINQAADVSGRFESITTTRAVLDTENGKTFFINNANGFVTTLPAPALGLRYTFIVGTAPTSGNHTIVSASSANIIKGLQNSVAGDAGDSGTADDTISFVANQALPADKVEVVSDGTSWFAYAISKVAAGITFTQAS